MSNYEELTNQDVDPVDVWEEMREGEYRLDAEQEARDLEADAAEAAKAPAEDEECQAEFIDGSWYGDDCPECRERVEAESAECEQCENGYYCSRHENGVYG